MQRGNHLGDGPKVKRGAVGRLALQGSFDTLAGGHGLALGVAVKLLQGLARFGGGGKLGKEHGGFS